MENAYAQALWNSIEKGMKPEDALHALRESLKREGREALLPRIANAFSRIAQRHANRNNVSLTVADKAHEHSAFTAVHEMLTKLGVSKDDVEVRVDPSLIGGWRLEGREQLIDASYKKHLLAIYRRATQSV